MLPLVLCLLLGERTHTPTIDDYFTLVTPTEVALSPDGKEVAFLQAAWADDKDARVTTLHVVEVATGKVRRLVTGKVTPRAVRWSKDGKALFYLAGVEKRGNQVWRIPADAVEPDPLAIRPTTDLE